MKRYWGCGAKQKGQEVHYTDCPSGVTSGKGENVITLCQGTLKAKVFLSANILLQLLTSTSIVLILSDSLISQQKRTFYFFHLPKSRQTWKHCLCPINYMITSFHVELKAAMSTHYQWLCRFSVRKPGENHHCHWL